MRPLGQIVVAQIKRLQCLEIRDIKGFQFVVAQVQPLQALQGTERGMQVFAIVQPVRGQLQAFELVHVPDRLGNDVQIIAIEFQPLQLRERVEELVRAPTAQLHAGQDQTGDMLERCRQRR
ncbi:hypothetical protein D3C86_1669080 [compost metagenome]